MAGTKKIIARLCIVVIFLASAWAAARALGAIGNTASPVADA